MKKRYSPINRWFRSYDSTGDIFRAQLIQLITGGGGGSTPVTITGVSPLSLVNAVAGNIQALYRYGSCVQNGTPSVPNPVDISCNNGTLTVIDDELPTEYKRVESIGFDGSTHYITNEKLFGSDEITITLDDTSKVDKMYLVRTVERHLDERITLFIFTAKDQIPLVICVMEKLFTDRNTATGNERLFMVRTVLLDLQRMYL